MPNGNSSFCFEPLRYLVRSSVRRRVPFPVDRRRIPMHTRLDEYFAAPEFGGEYFFQKTVAENREEFEIIDVGHELRRLIDKWTNGLTKRLKERFASVIPSTEVVDIILPQSLPERVYIPRIARGLPRPVYFHKVRPVAVIPISPVSMYILGNKREHVTKVIEDIKFRCEELNEVTADFGLELLKILTSRDYQEFLLERLEKIEKTDYGNPKNDFEKEVIQTCEETTTSLLSNLTIVFSEPTESFEYDLFIGFGDELRVIIEPTDYESLKTEIQDVKVGKDTLKSRVILGTLDKARRLKAESIVVVKGFPEKTFTDLKSLADSRGVSLMSDENYRNSLPFVLLNNLTRTLIPAP